MSASVNGSSTPEDPWTLSTPPGKSQYQAYRDPAAEPPALVVQHNARNNRMRAP